MLLHPRAMLRPDDAQLLLRGQKRAFTQMIAALSLFGLLYGAVMGTFGGVGADRLLQIIYSAVKVPLLLLITFALCLPSFFVINTLAGVRSDFQAVLRAMLAAQAGLTVVLASLAPLTIWWYAGTSHYRAAILFNGVMFAVASFAGQAILRRLYRPLIERNPRHRALGRFWLAMYIFVGIQLAWVMRPFVGDPGLPTQFFREDSWSNAYVYLARMIWQVLGG